MSRRYLCKVDANQPAIVEAIRKAGATVLHMHMLGKGAPDLAIGYGGMVLLCEVKQGNKKLTLDEQKWHEEWTGGVYLIRNIDDALNAVATLMRWAMILREAV